MKIKFNDLVNGKASDKDWQEYPALLPKVGHQVLIALPEGGTARRVVGLKQETEGWIVILGPHENLHCMSCQGTGKDPGCASGNCETCNGTGLKTKDSFKYT